MKKEELIDFLNFIREDDLNDYVDTETLVDKYLKSINSLPNGEASIISGNEHTKEVCHRCESHMREYYEYWQCLECGTIINKAN